MPTSWLSWRRSLACKTQPDDVHDPQSLNADPTSAGGRAKVADAAAVFVSTRRLYMRSSCSRSIANLRDVIHSSRRMDGARVPAAMPNFSPKSVESNDFVQSISQEAMFLQEQACNLHPHLKHANNQHHRQPSLHGKLSLDDIVATHHPNPFNHQHIRSTGSSANAHATSGSFYGTPLHPVAHSSAPPPHPPFHSQGGTGKGSNSFRKLSGCYDCKNPAVSLVVYKTTLSPDASGERGTTVNGKSTGSALPPVAPKAVCQRCGEAFPKYEALEQHHLIKHAVAELEVGDSSRNVVEIIFRTSWLRPPEPAPAGAAPSTSACGKLQIERVLKVNNLARTLARFEDYREGVKMRASKLPKKHPRCLADGNELLRFYGARLECKQLVQAGEHVEEGTAPSKAGVCSSASCIICKIIRSGFPKNRGPDGATHRGIVTTATRGRAHQIMVDNAASDGIREGTTTHTITECKSFREADIMHPSRRQDDAGRAAMSVSVCAKADRSIHSTRSDDRTGSLMAMLVCRVIAGRVHKPPQITTTAPPTPPHSGDLGPPGSGFDSIAGGDTWASGLPPHGMGLHSRFEELTVFNPRAILPCFVVLYRC